MAELARFIALHRAARGKVEVPAVVVPTKSLLSQVTEFLRHRAAFTFAFLAALLPFAFAFPFLRTLAIRSRLARLVHAILIESLM